MATITLTAQDRLDAETFLQTYLIEMIPDGDFSKGSYLYDLVVKSIAYTVAYLRAENRLALDRSSISRIQSMSASADRDDAADDALSNWFLTRKVGRPSRGKILVHVSAKDEYQVPVTTQFSYDGTHVFFPDYTSTQVIAATDITEVAGANGTVVDRYFTLSVVSLVSGEGYDVTPANWVSWDNFSPYVTRVESIAPFVGGQSVETTDALLTRATEAICVRDLNSVRSIRTTLRERFTTVDDVYVAGAGSPELQRDLSPQSLGMTQFHTGGFTDVYVKGPTVDAPTYEAPVGGTFVDPRPEVLHFTADGVSDFAALGVEAGMALRVHNPDQPGLEPTLYIIQTVSDHPKFLTVESRNPFPEERTGVSFSIGRLYPWFTDVVPFTPNTGQFTKSFSLSKHILLPQIPVFLIKRVMYFDSGSSQWVQLSRNTMRRDEVDSLQAQEYRLYYVDPHYALTGYQLALMEVGGAVAESATVRVEYETLSGFSDVHSFMADSFNRVACASVIAKAMFPVYLTFLVKYKLHTGATLSEDEMGFALSNFINTYPTTEALHVSKINAYILAQWGDRLAYAIPYADSLADPYTVGYELYAPDGSGVTYVSATTMSIDASHETAPLPRLPKPLELGISNSNLQYVTAPGLITFLKE